MKADERDDALNILACEIDKRPKGAPSFFDLQPSIQAVHRDKEGLRIDFDPAAAPAVQQLVEAERLCCADIGWSLRQSPALTLTIRAPPAQLDIFVQFLTT
ncbi:MAG: hypothetical protein AB7R89_20915 [Dehalococcoidia bacterium]